ncbi:MAG: hypothetical protein WKG03_12770 [Telluria sp.]
MKTFPTLTRLCGALLLAAAGSACSGVNNSAPATPPAPPPAVKAAAPAPATNLLQQLRAEIGSAACDSAKQCKSVAVGHKACGGPESYLAWSTKSSDAARVQQLADAYRDQRKAQDAASGMMSTCSMVMDPGATCNAGRCVSGGANATM